MFRLPCDLFIGLRLFHQVVVVCIMTQMNYLNKALDLFNTAIVSPVYYVMFTLLTILASIIMFRVSSFGLRKALNPAHLVETPELLARRNCYVYKPCKLLP